MKPVALISKFDPWRSAFCTCPSKLTFNPYTGCDHMCVYCYAAGYVQAFFNCRPKKDLVSRLQKDVAKLKGEIISIANSSDPYPTLETRLCLTRKCLEILSQQNCKIQIVTKSDLVVRDIDFLKKVPSVVSLTITTDDDDIAKIIEPNVPPTSKRLKAVATLLEKRIPVSVRVDPLIPFLNDDVESLMKTLGDVGVKHVTSSTYKIGPQNWKRFSAAVPNVSEKLKTLYFGSGERIGRYIYLPKASRIKLLETVGNLAKKYGIKFGTCREGLPHLNTAVCDGSWLLREPC